MSNKQGKFTRREKLTVTLFIAFIVIDLFAFIIGCGFARVTPMGFWIMGISGSMFAIFLLSQILKVSKQRKRYSQYLDIDKNELVDFYDIREGVVVRCFVHSNGSRRYKKVYSRTLYKIFVKPTINEDDEYSNMTVLEYNKRQNVSMLGKNSLKCGDKVKFYQNKDLPRDCFFISKIRK